MTELHELCPTDTGLCFQKIMDWIEGADHGVVLFSMGFIFNPKIVPKRNIEALLEAFGQLPQRVIAKFNEDPPPDVTVPTNVLILPFVPQQASENCEKMDTSIIIGITFQHKRKNL